MEAFLGTIQAFAFSFAPKGWASCDGGLLSISQNSALYSLIGSTYGGNGSSNFALPNLQGKMMVNVGPSNVLGQSGGLASVTLTGTNLPAHSHTLMGTSSAATQSEPAGALLALAGGTDNDTQATVSVVVYTPNGSLSPMNPQSISPTGASQPISVQNPYLTVNMCIALQGIFPTRP